MNQKIRWATLADIDDLVRLRFAYFAVEQILITPEQQSIIEANLRTYINRHLAVDFFRGTRLCRRANCSDRLFIDLRKAS